MASYPPTKRRRRVYGGSMANPEPGHKSATGPNPSAPTTLPTEVVDQAQGYPQSSKFNFSKNINLKEQVDYNQYGGYTNYVFTDGSNNVKQEIELQFGNFVDLYSSRVKFRFGVPAHPALSGQRMALKPGGLYNIFEKVYLVLGNNKLTVGETDNYHRAFHARARSGRLRLKEGCTAENFEDDMTHMHFMTEKSKQLVFDANPCNCSDEYKKDAITEWLREDRNYIYFNPNGTTWIECSFKLHLLHSFFENVQGLWCPVSINFVMTKDLSQWLEPHYYLRYYAPEVWFMSLTGARKLPGLSKFGNQTHIIDAGRTGLAGNAHAITFPYLIDPARNLSTINPIPVLEFDKNYSKIRVETFVVDTNITDGTLTAQETIGLPFTIQQWVEAPFEITTGTTNIKQRIYSGPVPDVVMIYLERLPNSKKQIPFDMHGLRVGGLTNAGANDQTAWQVWGTYLQSPPSPPMINSDQFTGVRQFNVSSHVFANNEHRFSETNEDFEDVYRTGNARRVCFSHPETYFVGYVAGTPPAAATNFWVSAVTPMYRVRTLSDRLILGSDPFWRYANLNDRVFMNQRPASFINKGWYRCKRLINSLTEGVFFFDPSPSTGNKPPDTETPPQQCIIDIEMFVDPLRFYGHEGWQLVPDGTALPDTTDGTREQTHAAWTVTAAAMAPPTRHWTESAYGRRFRVMSLRPRYFQLTRNGEVHEFAVQGTTTL